MMESLYPFWEPNFLSNGNSTAHLRLPGKLYFVGRCVTIFRVNRGFLEAWNLVYKQNGDWVKFGLRELFLLPVQPKWVVRRYNLHYRTSDRNRREIMACGSILQYRVVLFMTV